MAEHTQLPWRITGKGTIRANVDWIGNINWRNREANAAIVIKAVNSHAALVKALTDLVEVSAPNIYPQPDKPNSAWAVLQRARFALALATAEVSPPVAK